eukprot:CAMPEP_0198221868 /NCGR_PEP_ID=MMETSP1445-20131203/85664_1 /TAXON_ID=36898 /ORGANISM="Pyramimonas sp., Strain CCMP2087" /LENGTH=58 /DNA_ID=CAMNT_0043900175 /DNA_START=732 /DNA_END=905 /DNA_ORIENTATION=-
MVGKSSNGTRGTRTPWDGNLKTESSAKGTPAALDRVDGFATRGDESGIDLASGAQVRG